MEVCKHRAKLRKQLRTLEDIDDVVGLVRKTPLFGDSQIHEYYAEMLAIGVEAAKRGELYASAPPERLVELCILLLDRYLDLVIAGEAPRPRLQRLIIALRNARRKRMH